jgi:hypothetical protein
MARYLKVADVEELIGALTPGSDKSFIQHELQPLQNEAEDFLDGVDYVYQQLTFGDVDFTDLYTQLTKLAATATSVSTKCSGITKLYPQNDARKSLYDLEHDRWTLVTDLVLAAAHVTENDAKALAALDWADTNRAITALKTKHENMYKSKQAKTADTEVTTLDPAKSPTTPDDVTVPPPGRSKKQNPQRGRQERARTIAVARLLQAAEAIVKATSNSSKLYGDAAKYIEMGNVALRPMLERAEPKQTESKPAPANSGADEQATNFGKRHSYVVYRGARYRLITTA